jgi:outer membrane protein OmpA-like peptidoglycan-associated protein
VTKILNHDRTYKLLIAGHADDRGDDNYNIRLSQRRVDVVTNYLVSQGILKDRIIQKAYGESLPQIPCYAVDCSEDDHQKNRRAEFVLRYITAN